MTDLRSVFAEVAPTYERANRILTLGLDRPWRRAAAREAVAGGGRLWLDVGSGTGDMAEELARRIPENGRVVALDFSGPMMAGLKSKPAFLRRGAAVRADASRLPFPGGTFDAVTVSFAVRNLNRSREALRETFAEIRRVLKPEGRLVLVETSRPPLRPVRGIFFALVRGLVPLLGERISGSKSGYAYLAATIPRFYGAGELAVLLEEAGFTRVRFRRMCFGAAAVHVAAG